MSLFYAMHDAGIMDSSIVVKVGEVLCKKEYMRDKVTVISIVVRDVSIERGSWSASNTLTLSVLYPLEGYYDGLHGLESLEYARAGDVAFS